MIFNLWHKKERKENKGYKTIHTFTKRIENKTNDNNNESNNRNDNNNNNDDNNNNNNNKKKE